MAEQPIRIGTLGAATITPMALIRPARRVPRANVVAVAARNPEKAAAFATKHGIPTVHADYAALIADPGIDAVYNPLPNSLHAEWTIAAVAAGKHVLCEKPFASNAAEAVDMAAAARVHSRAVMEAFHWRYHPLAARMREILTGGDIGDVEHYEVQFCIPLPPMRPDIRYDFGLAGGATMDLGCYAINMIRFLAGAEPTVEWAQAKLSSAQVDQQMLAELAFRDGRSARFRVSMWGWPPLRMAIDVRGTHGTMHVFNPLQPKIYNRIKLDTQTGTRAEHVRGRFTYEHQLEAFCDAILDGEKFPTTPEDAISNMRVIDAVYEAAGLDARGN